MSADLTVSEAERLDACEQVIERGLATFVDVGTALLEVRDSRLYRMAYPTFEAYCAERWNMTRPRAYQFIDAAGVVNGLSTIGIQALPANERTARELSGLAPDEQRAVWAEAVATAPGSTPNPPPGNGGFCVSGRPNSINRFTFRKIGLYFK